MGKRLLPVLGILGLLGLITSCGTTTSTSTTGPDAETVRKPDRPAFDPNAPTLVIALDASESMLESDPDRFSVEGARLAGALLDTGANVGVLSFNKRSKSWAKLRSLRGPSDREKLEKAVGGIRFRGQTDFRNALAASFKMLAEAKAKPGSSVLFLTDGRPDLGSDEASERNLEEALAALEPFKARGYRIFTIGLGPEVNAELLNRMSAETGAPPTWLIGKDGGAARDHAKQLLGAFLQVTGDVNRYLEFDEGLAPVEIFPGTRKLVYVLVRDDPETGFGQVTRDGKAVADSAYYRYPRVPSNSSRFEVVFVERPPEGVWHAEVKGDPDIGAILEDIALDVALVEPPRKNVFVGQPIPLAVDVKFTHPGWKAILAERARATVDLVSAETRKTLAKDVPLLPKSRGSSRVRFQGAPAARLSRPGGPERVFAKVRFTLTRRTRGESSRNLSTAVTVSPNPDAKVVVAPAVLDLDALWVDDEVAAQKVRVTNPTAAPVKITVQDGRSCVAEPKEFQLASGSSKELTVRLGKGLTPGALEDGLTVHATPVGPGAKPSKVPLPVRATLYELRAPKEMDLGSAAVDPKAVREVGLDIPLEVRPATPGLIQLTAMAVSGPDSLSARVETAGTRNRLLVTVPANAKKGIYRTTLTVTAKGKSLRPREFAVRFEVWTEPEAAIEKPKPVEVTSLGAKEVDASMRLQLRYPTAGASLVVKKGALVLDGDGPALNPDDYEMVPEDGWDGKTLDAGTPRTLTARIYVSSDVRNGTYRGQIELVLKAPGRPDGHALVPVVVRVAR